MAENGIEAKLRAFMLRHLATRSTRSRTKGRSFLIARA